MPQSVLPKRIKFLVQKIVRDKPRISKEPDVESKFSDLTPEDKIYHVKRKLVEEAQEILEARDREDLVSEMGDLWDVFKKLCLLEGVTEEEIEEASEKKKEKRGGFDLCLYQDYVILPETHPFVESFRKTPEKYPEVPLSEEDY